ncbi:hypothetical protein AAG570_012104 [Ranatra chinensis]|uniref:Uncharacterized protein n=1 Tax=Ranatra chinensis TaxID=642074 RepID=A0ABD0YHU1_9HEMI
MLGGGTERGGVVFREGGAGRESGQPAQCSVDWRSVGVVLCPTIGGIYACGVTHVRSVLCVFHEGDMGECTLLSIRRLGDAVVVGQIQDPDGGVPHRPRPRTYNHKKGGKLYVPIIVNGTGVVL